MQIACKLKDRNVCCCKYDVEMGYLLDALRWIRQKKHEECKCPCSLCRPGPGDTTCKIHEKVRAGPDNLTIREGK